MNPTSHFLGLSVKYEIFTNLFISLEKYLKKNNLNKDIELQDISSLHLTLYYFGEKIKLPTLLTIKEDLTRLNKKENLFSLYLDQFGHFESQNNKYLGYLYPSNSRNLEKINLQLKKNYLSEVADNDYPKYIPHLSIFKVTNSQLFHQHSSDIMVIINKHLKIIKKLDAFKAFNLYAVDSNCSPEKQKIIL